MLSMLLLGFSAGLPFFLVFQTLSAWLRQDGIQRATIGMLAWVGIVYSIKFLWAPIVDRVAAAVAAPTGRAPAQLDAARAGGHRHRAVSTCRSAIRRPTCCALRCGRCSSRSARRRRTLRSMHGASSRRRREMQGAMAAAYQLGYRGALIAGSAGALTIAAGFGWHASYATMAALVGSRRGHDICESRARGSASRANRATRGARHRLARPAHSLAALDAHRRRMVHRRSRVSADRFLRPARLASALLILLFMSSYRLTEFTMGSMANPFYIDQGYTLTQIATVVKVFGLATSMVGIVHRRHRDREARHSARARARQLHDHGLEPGVRGARDHGRADAGRARGASTASTISRRRCMALR